MITTKEELLSTLNLEGLTKRENIEKEQQNLANGFSIYMELTLPLQAMLICTGEILIRAINKDGLTNLSAKSIATYGHKNFGRLKKSIKLTHTILSKNSNLK